MKLSDTALIVLNGAVQREDRLVPRRSNTPPVVDVNVCRALVKQGLVELVRAPLGATDIVMVREDETPMAFVIADAGFRALNLDPPRNAEPAAPGAPTQGTGAGVEATTEAPTAPHAAADAETVHERATAADAPVAALVAPTGDCKPRPNLRQAAAAVLTAWDDESNPDADPLACLQGPIAALRDLLAGRAARTGTAGPHKPREGTKQQAVLTLLRRAEGATVTQVMDATGWASHTVRGFFAGLKKKGIPVEAMERVRRVGPDKQGAKGSITIYHVVAG